LRDLTRLDSGFSGRQAASFMLLFTAIALVVWTYGTTYVSVVQKWISDTAFSHGFLVLPIAIWLAWRKREELAHVGFRPSAIGIPAVLLCTAGWVIGRGTGVLVIEQFSAVAMIPALVVAALGLPAARVLIMPLGFLLFLVPFGRGLVPFLMHATADFSTLLLKWSGVPVFRTYMQISIPAGSFEVARACSGLNYVITSLVLGALYAYLNFHGWLKRAVCMVAFAGVPIILNGLRVYFTILVSHLTDMRFGPGAEHVTFGRIFFAVMMLAMFWFGRRWHDDAPSSPVPVASGTNSSSGFGLEVWPLLLACLIAVGGPLVVQASSTKAHQLTADAQRLIVLPCAVAGWQGPIESADLWRPDYIGGIVERKARYVDRDGMGVDVFVVVYGIGTSMGTEMISHSNVISAADRRSLEKDVLRSIQLADGSVVVVREVALSGGSSPRLVWHWFRVGDQSAASRFTVKALEGLAFVTRGAVSERLVTVSTQLDDSAGRRLREFVRAHGQCVASGFVGEACCE